VSLFRTAFGAYVNFRIRRGLDGVWVRGLEHALAALEGGPVVFAANHVSWWDAMLMFPLDDALGRSSRVWMDAKNLQKHPFFRSLGALPLDDSGPAALRRSVREASDWLVAPRRSLWVFPQGRYVPSWIRPLELRPGAMFIARRTKATVLPVGIAYGFRQAPTPAAVVSFGPPVHPEHVEAGLLRELAATDAFLTGGDPAFQPLVSGVVGGTEQSLAARALGLVVRT
jgi:1-acyl-sn-glycerol-3-phosphate acyltransferase